MDAVRMLLELGGAQVFVDWRSIEPGEAWEAKLGDELEVADVLCVFWSRHTQRSRWVASEYTAFLATFPDRPCVPLCADETPLPTPLSQRQAPDFLALTNAVLKKRREHARVGISRAESARLIRRFLVEEGIVMTSPQWARFRKLAFGSATTLLLLKGVAVLAAIALIGASALRLRPTPGCPELESRRSSSAYAGELIVEESSGLPPVSVSVEAPLAAQTQRTRGARKAGVSAPPDAGVDAAIDASVDAHYDPDSYTQAKLKASSDREAELKAASDALVDASVDAPFDAGIPALDRDILQLDPKKLVRPRVPPWNVLKTTP